MQKYDLSVDGSGVGALTLRAPIARVDENSASYSSVISSQIKRTLTSVPDFAVSLAGDLTDLAGAVVGKQDAGQGFYNAYSWAGLTGKADAAAEKIAAAYVQSGGAIGLDTIAAMTRQYAGGRNPVRRAIAQGLFDRGIIGDISEVYTHEAGAKTKAIGAQEFVVGYYDSDDKFGSLMKNISPETWTGLIVGGAAIGGGVSAAGSYLAKRAVVDSAFGVTSKGITDNEYFGESSQAVANALARTGKFVAFSPTFGLIGMGAEALARAGKNIGKGDSSAAKAIGAGAEYLAFAAEVAMAASLIDSMTGNNGHEYLGETSLGDIVAKASRAVDSVPRYAMSGLGNAVDKAMFSTAYAQVTDTAPAANPQNSVTQDTPQPAKDATQPAPKAVAPVVELDAAVHKYFSESIDANKNGIFDEDATKLDLGQSAFAEKYLTAGTSYAAKTAPAPTVEPAKAATPDTAAAAPKSDAVAVLGLASKDYTIDNATQITFNVPEALRGENHYVVLSMDMINAAHGTLAGQEANLGWERVFIPVGDGKVTINLDNMGLGANNDFGKEAYNLRVVHLDNIGGLGLTEIEDSANPTNNIYLHDTDSFLKSFEAEFKTPNTFKTANTLAFGHHKGFDDSLLLNEPIKYTGDRPDLESKIVLNGGTWNFPSAKAAGGSFADSGLSADGKSVQTYTRKGDYDNVYGDKPIVSTPAVASVAEQPVVVDQSKVTATELAPPVGTDRAASEPAPQEQKAYTQFKLSDIENDRVKPSPMAEPFGIHLHLPIVYDLNFAEQIDKMFSENPEKLAGKDPNKDGIVNLAERSCYKVRFNESIIPDGFVYKVSLEAERMPNKSRDVPEPGDELYFRQAWYRLVDQVADRWRPVLGSLALDKHQNRFDRLADKGSILTMDEIVHRNHGNMDWRLPEFERFDSHRRVEVDGAQTNQFIYTIDIAKDTNGDGKFDEGDEIVFSHERKINDWNRGRKTEAAIETGVIAAKMAHDYGEKKFDEGYREGWNDKPNNTYTFSPRPGKCPTIPDCPIPNVPGTLIGGDNIGDGLGGVDTITGGLDDIGDAITKLSK